jgi:preprotein translocase subunit SecG
MWTIITSALSLVCGVLLMFVILLQRGRGGGLAGAFGGLGGQSAFGTKAGDVFTRITIVLAVVWVVLNAATIYAMRFESEGRFDNPDAAKANAVAPGAGKSEDPGFETVTSPTDEKKSDTSEKKADGASTKSEEKITPPAGEKSGTEKKAESTPPATEAKPAEGAAADKAKDDKAPAADVKPAEPPKEPGK